MAATAEDIKEILRTKIGLNTSSIDSSYFNSTLLNFMEAIDCESTNELFDLLKLNQTKLVSFAEYFLEKSSWFFRDKETFNVLAEFINFQIKETDKIRILSMGCGTGEEPYSIAMSLVESGFNPKNFIVEAIDISPTVIEIARQALYNDNSFKDTDIRLKEKYFQQAEDIYILHPQIAQLVNFYKGNFIEQNFFAGRQHYDIIFAKNIFNFLTRDATMKLVNNILLVLSDSGILVATENEIDKFYTGQFQKTVYGETILKKINQENSIRQNEKIRGTKKRHTSKLFTNILKFKKSHVMPYINAKGMPANNFPLNSRIREIQQMLHSGLYENALENCNELIKEDSQNADIYYWMGYINEAMNDLNKAEDFYHKALYIEPEHYEAIVKLIIIFESKGWTDKADLLKKRIEKISGLQ